MTTRMLSIVLVVLLMWVVAWNVRALKARQALLLLASYLFYSSWGIGFLGVLIASSLLNFAWGSLLRRRLTIGYLWCGVALNVLLLCFFKYLPPLFEAGWPVPRHAEFLRHIVMPVGISFWTFQGLSYLFDVYREEEIDPSPLEFCLYMAFWPVVLSGPVCRLPDMLPQFRQEPAFSWDNISAGALRLLQGLFMKMVVAQLLGASLTQGAGIVAGFDQVPGGLGGIDAWLLAVGFGFQLFFDFAGYSHLVIGTARLFGIQLPENFHHPFLSATPSVFWTRWHMSLSFWIRDYVFVPLAILRRDRWWPYVVFPISMVIFGLWHAAKWTFILWGFYHGMLLVMHRLGQQLKRRFAVAMPRYAGGVLAWGSTFSLVSLGWIFFRAADLNEALSMLGLIFSPRTYLHLAMPRSFYAFMAFIVIAYFTYEGLGTSLARWRAHYRETLRVVPQGIMDDKSVPSSAAVLAFQIAELFVHRMWWWLAPAIFVLALFMSLAALNRSAAVSVTPFMYMTF